MTPSDRQLRVLHLLSPPPTGHGLDGATIACAAALQHTADHAHTICIIAGGEAETRCAELGLRTTDRIVAPLGRATLALNGLRRFVRDRGPFDAVQCWSAGIEATARRACGPMTRILPLPSAHILAAAAADAGTHADRANARHALELDDRDFVVALLADPPASGDARQFIFLIGLLDIAGTTICGLVDARSASLARARRFHARAQINWRLLVTRRPLPSLIAACDAAAVVARATDPHAQPPVALIAAAHASGVPVVAAAGIVQGRLYPDEARPDCTASLGSANAIAGALLRLANDRPRLALLSDAVRRHARELVERSDYARTLERAWRGRDADAHEEAA
ncbi:MAG TPA: hypothetical protein PLU35_04655 [Phycisphaerales bacterium]|nr:hypothetical protein [Phycisphaerales bacterium]